MQQCTCTTTQHDNHPGGPCEKPATTKDAYCQECHDKEKKTHADTNPDMPSYASRTSPVLDGKPSLESIE